MMCETIPASGWQRQRERLSARRYLSAAISSDRERLDCDSPSTENDEGLAAASAMSAGEMPGTGVELTSAALVSDDVELSAIRP